MVNVGSSASPACAAARASASEPSNVNAAARKKCDKGQFGLASILRRDQMTASASALSCNLALANPRPRARRGYELAGAAIGQGRCNPRHRRQAGEAKILGFDLAQ